MPRHARGYYKRSRGKRGRKLNVSWERTYGTTIEDRAENMASGIVPPSVTYTPPLSKTPAEITIVRSGRRSLRFNFDTALFPTQSHRYVEYVPADGRRERDYVYVRSQRFGEIVEGPRSTKSNATGSGVINNGVLESVYVVALSGTLANPMPQTCTCAYEGDCKHMRAVEIVYANANAIDFNIGLSLLKF